MEMADPVSYALAGATRYESVLRRLQRVLERQSQRLGLELAEIALGTEVAVRPVVLIFSRPSIPLFRDEVLPDVAYLHFSSGEDADFFCMGFPARPTVGERGPDILIDRFDDEAFIAAQKEFQRRTTWKYSGETDLILLSAYLTPYGAKLDLEHALPVHLEKAVKDGTIFSARTFIQRVLHASAKVPAKDVVDHVSDMGVLRSAGEVLGKWIAAAVGLDYEAVKQVPALCVRDIRSA